MITTTITSIELLPNEVWILFMRFLTTIDLYRALAGLNHRINCLLSEMPAKPVLDTSECAGDIIHLRDMRQLITGKDYWAKHLLSSIDTIRLCGTLSSDALCDHYQSPIRLSSFNTSFSMLFPSLRRLYVTENAMERIDILELLLPWSKSLRYVHFIFPSFTACCAYLEILHQLNEHQLSFYSMIFDVKNDKLNGNQCLNKYELKTLYWPNTVHLSIFIKKLTDLIVLFDPNILPVLDHLSVTFVRQDKHYSNNYSLLNNFTKITSRLHSLKLCYLSLNNLLIFFASVDFPLLKELILIEINDDTLDRFADFQKYFQAHKNMPNLRLSSLQFLLRFPGELENDWRRQCHWEWPFDTTYMDYCLEEHRLSVSDYIYSKSLTPKKEYSLLIFTRSPLFYCRTVHNHSFTMNLKQKSSSSSIKWICEHINSSEQLLNSLVKFKTIKELKFANWRGTRAQNSFVKVIRFPEYFNQLQLNKLRSLSFFEVDTSEKFLLHSQKHSLLRLLLKAAPQLVKLTINWNYVMDGQSTFANENFAVSPFLHLRHLHLWYSNRHECLDVSKLVDISLLSKFFPRLISLWTSGLAIYPDENLGTLVASIVTHFQQLVEVIINKKSPNRYRDDHDLQTLIAQKKYIENLLRNNTKLRDLNHTNICWTHSTELHIWL